MVDRMKGEGRAPPSLDWADFSIMIECTPESGNCHSVYSVVHLLVYKIEVQLPYINLTKILNEWNLNSVLKLMKEFKTLTAFYDLFMGAHVN